MPVEEFNAMQMGTEALNILASAETTTYFWSINSSIVVWIVIILAIFLGLIAVLVILPKIVAKRMLG